ncbi:MAG: hypothetical protein H7A25_08645 [Leptospiraceae bacterium]|nr:hypothetical protein [Leptospiraceae bacterium]MCP5499957.1 hypothetical protein [Leptospiraceae bacterium]
MKKVPNPYGKLGSPKHRLKVEEVETSIQNRGFMAIKEYLLRLFGNKCRYIDVVAMKDDETEPVEYHQVGKITKSGLPVKRERIVLQEIKQEKGVEPQFHPYNNYPGKQDEK